MAAPRLTTTSMNKLAARLQEKGEEGFSREYPHPFLVLVFEPPPDEEEEDESTVQTRQTGLSAIMQQEEAEATGKRVVPLVMPRGGRQTNRAVVGRQDGCQVQIRAQKVSREHAAFFERDGRWWLEDLGSANGTRLNGKRLPPHRPNQLKSGDMVAFWMFLFQFVDEAAFRALLRGMGKT